MSGSMSLTIDSTLAEIEAEYERLWQEAQELSRHRHTLADTVGRKIRAEFAARHGGEVRGVVIFVEHMTFMQQQEINAQAHLAYGRSPEFQKQLQDEKRNTLAFRRVQALFFEKKARSK